MSIFKSERAAYPWANPRQTDTLENVLRASAPQRIARPERANLQIAPNSPKQALIDKIATRVRALYVAGQRRVAYDEKRPEVFFDACFETYCTWQELDTATDDPVVLAIADAVFERVGFASSNVRPTTLEAQVRMQIEVIQAAKAAKLLFAPQAALALD